jgi:hypothetical protein
VTDSRRTIRFRSGSEWIPDQVGDDLLGAEGSCRHHIFRRLLFSLKNGRSIPMRPCKLGSHPRLDWGSNPTCNMPPNPVPDLLRGLKTKLQKAPAHGRAAYIIALSGLTDRRFTFSPYFSGNRLSSFSVSIAIDERTLLTASWGKSSSLMTWLSAFRSRTTIFSM